MNTAKIKKPSSNSVAFNNLRAGTTRMNTGNTNTRLQTGFQLVELIIAIAIIAIVGLIAVPSFSDYFDDVDRVSAITDITDITVAIEQYYSAHGEYPSSLSDIGRDGLRDPWETAYYYLRIDGAPTSGRYRLNRGMLRKDKNLAPVNSDFDLYSAGKDTQTRPPFTVKISHDDIVRASNGKFLSYAADF